MPRPHKASHLATSTIAAVTASPGLPDIAEPSAVTGVIDGRSDDDPTDVISADVQSDIVAARHPGFAAAHAAPGIPLDAAPHGAGDRSNTAAASGEPPHVPDHALNGSVESSADSLAMPPTSASRAAEEPWPDDVWPDELIQPVRSADSPRALGAEPWAGDLDIPGSATRMAADRAGEAPARKPPVVLDGADLNDADSDADRDIDTLGGLSAIYAPDLVATWAVSAGAEGYRRVGALSPADDVPPNGTAVNDPALAGRLGQRLRDLADAVDRGVLDAPGYATRMRDSEALVVVLAALLKLGR